MTHPQHPQHYALQPPPKAADDSWLQLVFVLAPLLTGGIAGALPFVMAEHRIKNGKADAAALPPQALLRARVQVFGALAVVIILLGLLGNMLSFFGTLGGILAFIVGVGTSVMAALMRKGVFPPVAAGPVNLPGVSEALARRTAREHYRHLAVGDAMLAREMLVGRPDMLRQYDDGGLLDINSLPKASLMHFAYLSEDEADEIISLRGRQRITCAEDLVVHTKMPHNKTDWMKEYGLFI
jgi:hypothetical protein